MNSKQVLSKIAKMLNLSEEVSFTDAKTVDGTILQSKTFDLGETVEVVSEDGTKSPAPDGEHEIALKDSEGKEVVIRIETKDGVITERENVEEENPETEMEGEEAMEGETTDVNVSGGLEMAKDFVKSPKGLESDPAHALPMGTDEDPRNRVGSDADDKKDPIISLTYRISELESAIADLKAKFGEEKVNEVVEMEEEEEEVEVKKLDGAPVEMSNVNLSSIKPSNNKREGNYQSSFLSKLYK
jgi:hypothetical protein